MSVLPFGTLYDLASWRGTLEEKIMRALCWHGKGDVRVDTVPDPKIQHPRDAVIKITACAICGSDLHLLDGYQPTMESGDILGHENMGEVLELGSDVKNLKIGDRVASAFLATDRVHVLRQAIMCCRKGGTVSIPGVYVGMGDKIPLGAAMNKGLTIKTGQTHAQAYTKPLLKRIEAGDIDRSFVVTHPANLEDAPAMYKKFRDKEDGVIKVVLRPGR
jgi:threonine dehydrogenase-like Zn-dependent dehydrogenase